MNNVLFLAGIAGLLLAGCTPAPLTRADYDGLVVCHPDVLDQVERAARRTFAQVYWHNCPKATLRVI
jgi:hypothetical protein